MILLVKFISQHIHILHIILNVWKFKIQFFFPCFFYNVNNVFYIQNVLVFFCQQTIICSYIICMNTRVVPHQLLCLTKFKLKYAIWLTAITENVILAFILYIMKNDCMLNLNLYSTDDSILKWKLYSIFCLFLPYTHYESCKQKFVTYLNIYWLRLTSNNSR